MIPEQAPDSGSKAGPACRVILADLHVHLGRSMGRPVKVTASPSFDLRAAVDEARLRKGLDVLGLVDSCSGPVLEELRGEVGAGRLRQLPDGGLLSEGSGAGGKHGRPLLLILGCEVELVVAGARVHFLAYLPGLQECSRLRERLLPHLRNPDLGSQMAHGLGPVELGECVRGLGGVFGLAHAFTPHRGFYGSTGRTLRDVFEGIGPAGAVDFVEIGLSADTAMADMLSELAATPLIASSDAHGPEAVGREATALRVREDEPGFGEMRLALEGRRGRRIAATYGLDPRLGKYHRSTCGRCGWTAASVTGASAEEAFLSCPGCGGGRAFVTGVWDRIKAIADRSAYQAAAGPVPRPPYHRHLPLRFLPGIGQVTRCRLLEAFGSEIDVLHHVPFEALAKAAGRPAAEAVITARSGGFAVRPGGGGAFGAVVRTPPGS
jgi:uncharacterized protein (TIGR00375 family)